MSRAPIISGTRKFPKPARIGTMTRKIIVVPWIVTAWLYELLVRKRLVRRRELRADQQREEAAEREEDERRPDVEDPDPLVVDGRQPRGDAAAAPVGAVRRDGVSTLTAICCCRPSRAVFVYATSASIWSAVQSLPTAGILPTPVAEDRRQALRVVEQRVARRAPGRCRSWSSRWQTAQTCCHSSLPSASARRVRGARSR